ncbi:DExH-box ATP-dependent RNA helicase DExH3-like [Eutrema salsugineum]|uniref:DExH-box ATP-dependent RNA helicase DExH3-like n=1 Tax=Eutrema salsugineum TaxID=72664 RepID=UPI000CED16E4|nr:DExH-box ATP-dependent RNA helicase DExH3-like [Eutrema salsugineum]
MEPNRSENRFNCLKTSATVSVTGTGSGFGRRTRRVLYMLKSTIGLEWRRRSEFLYLPRHSFRYLQSASHYHEQVTDDFDPYYEQRMDDGEINQWRLRFSAFLESKYEQEIVSQNWHGFQKISELASRMGLHSLQYAKAVVFSKAPLLRYRSDLDERRLRREVVLPFSVQSEVDAHLQAFLDDKQTGILDIPKSKRTGLLATGDRHYEKSEPPLPENLANLLQRILHTKSFQLKNMQQNWLNSPQGQKMLEFRESLPAYKEKDDLFLCRHRLYEGTVPLSPRNASLVCNIEECNKLSYDEHLVRAIICAGLFPGICSVVNLVNKTSFETMDDKQARLCSNTVIGLIP